MNSAAPWWLRAGPAICDFCLGGFHEEAGYRCRDCDRPVCPACAEILHAARIVLCPECGDGEGG